MQNKKSDTEDRMMYFIKCYLKQFDEKKINHLIIVKYLRLFKEIIFVCLKSINKERKLKLSAKYPFT